VYDIWEGGAGGAGTSTVQGATSTEDIQ
jgi:hypothetical protein